MGVVLAGWWLPGGWARFGVGIALLAAALAAGAWWLLRARRGTSPRPPSYQCPECGRELASGGALYAHSMTAHLGGLEDQGR